MKSATLKQRKLVMILIGALILMVILVTIVYGIFLQDSSENNSSNNIKISEEVTYTSEREINEAKSRSGIPFDRGSVDASNLDYYWLDGTVVDGNFTCLVFNAQTYQVYGSTYTTAGFGSPSTSERTYFQNQEYDIDFIDQTIDSICTREF